MTVTLQQQIVCAFSVCKAQSTDVCIEGLWNINK